MKLKAEAKINLTLDLTGVLPDGYHSISTVMANIGLYDTVTVKEGESGITLAVDSALVPCDATNTAFRAAKLFFDKTGLAPSVHITVEKRIPSGAGLGGGSADGAAVLRALNLMYPGLLTDAELFSLALSVGADVPFCLAGGCALCRNYGEIMSPLPLPELNVVILKPEIKISTGQAYGNFDKYGVKSHPSNDLFLYYAAKADYKEALKYSANVFEELADIPDAGLIKKAFYDTGAYFAQMSGSGSAFFGLYDTAGEAASAAEKLRIFSPVVTEKVWAGTTGSGTGYLM